MHSTITRTQSRAERVLRERIAPFIHRPVGVFGIESWAVEGGQAEPVTKEHALGLAVDDGRELPVFTPFEVGQLWGPAWGTTWFKISGTVPADLNPADQFELYFDLGWEDHSVGFQCEGLVMTPSGRILKALNPKNRWVDLTGIAGPGQDFELFLEAASNPLLLEVPPFQTITSGEKETAGPAPIYELKRADLNVFEPEIFNLHIDLEVVVGLAGEISKSDPRHHRLLRAADKAMDELDPQNLAASAKTARGHLTQVLSQPANASAHKAAAVGHAHIDSAWLWPVRETARKVIRTVSNTLSLMDNHPDFIYAMSSAQQFAWLEEHAPDQFARVTERVAEGRFIPVGGMWVEADVTMPSGEALVRQILHGQHYMKERFGSYNTILWLPDSFGYSGALPQLAKLGGFTSFLTQKISWNDTNKFPHHTFFWQGIDGTQLLTHFPPVDTYGAEVTPKELGYAVRNFQDKEWSDHSLVPFGYGDGGGGPTREMLGRIDRFRNLEGAPTVTQRHPEAFFADLHSETNDSTPVWSGELVLELHRATFTTQVAMKQGNRKSESLLREVEARAVAAMLGGHAYPYDELGQIWEEVLLHQFHDILPGTSISWVHREARATYQRLENQLRALATQAEQTLPALVQINEMPAAETKISVDTSARTIDTAFFALTFDSDGYVTSWLDKSQDREIVPAQARLGELRLLQDHPVVWDAWDVDRGARRTANVIASAHTFMEFETGGRMGVRVTREFGNSTVHTTYLVAGTGAELEVTVDVDWHESEKFLTMALPLDIATNTAQFETQFGYVTRNLHENTSWDWAQYETCAHRYIHVGEPGYGVAITNNGSYGYEVLARAGGGVDVMASIVRAPHYPDPETDQGSHSKTWVLSPVAGMAQTVALAQDTNRVLAPVAWPVWAENLTGMVVVDAIKAAHDRSGDVIVRLYEAVGGRAKAALKFSELFGPEILVQEVDLLEDSIDLSSLRISGRRAEVSLSPFQVLSLRVSSATDRGPFVVATEK